MTREVLRQWTKHDCGCADYRCQWHTTQAWAAKETKPMSTKQRGDVEKVTPDAGFRIYNHAGFHLFTRDEFRRIWEAGNAEFGHAETYKEAADRRGRLLSEKDAEIARLKAAIHYPTFDTNLLREIERMRAWFGKIQEWTSPDSPAEMAKKALRGEKAP